MCLVLESEGNLEKSPVLSDGAVPKVNPESNITAVVDAFLESQIPKKSTRRGYRRNLIEAFGLMCVEKLSEIQAIHLVNYKVVLFRAHAGDATRAQALIALRSFLRWTSAMGGHDLRMEQVLYLLPVPKVNVITPHNSLTEKEVWRLLEAAKAAGPRDHALVLVALGAGLRVSELVHVDVHRRTHERPRHTRP